MDRRSARRIIFIVALGVLEGCVQKHPSDRNLDSGKWLIQSYDEGIITARINDFTYKARCDGHRALKPDQFIWDAAPSFPCFMAIEAVGTPIAPITINTDFKIGILVMGNVGLRGSVVLRRGDDVETFTITAAHKDTP
jgi:hypothetical protein